METITAFRDSAGKLHAQKNDAVEAEFIYMMQRVWGAMPDQRDRGDPVVIARIIASSVYPTVLTRLKEALKWYEENR